MVKVKARKRMKDFQKVKLKVGKKLPKGLNVTDTSFKTKKILIPNQIRERDASTSEPLTVRKLNIQDLISRLHHYNSSVRLDALSGLQELMSKNPDILLPNLKLILDVLGAASLDEDDKVRQAGYRVFRVVLSNVTMENISPFVTSLISHLGCAMNHISVSVRRNSLAFLSALLDCIPEAIASAPYTILENFLEMISRISENRPAKRMRVLSFNPSSRLSGRDWWNQVLTVLDQFLRASMAQWFPAEETDETTEIQYNSYDPGILVFGNSLKIKKNISLSLYSGLLSAGSSHSNVKHRVRDFSQNLIPLLFEMWMELDPSTTTEDVLIGRETFNTFHTILKIILLLIDWLKKEDTKNMVWFQDCFKEQFSSHFESRFPYLQCRTVSGKKGKKGSNLQNKDISLLSINLLICEVLTNVASSEQSKTMFAFISELLDKDQIEKSSEFKSVLKVVQLLLNDLTLQQRQTLLTSVWNFYKMSSLREKDKTCVFEFLFELVKKLQMISLSDIPALMDILRMAPSLLVSSVSESELDMNVFFFFENVAPYRIPSFLDGLQDCAFELMDLLPVVGDEHVVKTMIHSISTVPQLTAEHFQKLYYICSEALPMNLTVHLLELLAARVPDERNNEEYLSAYVSFLFNLLTGMSQMKQEQCISAWSEANWPVLLELFPEISIYTVVPIDIENLDEHRTLCESILNCLQMLPNRLYFEGLLCVFLEKFLETYQHLSCSCAMALLMAFSECCESTRRKMKSILDALTASFLCITAVYLECNDTLKDDTFEFPFTYMKKARSARDVSQLFFSASQLPLSLDSIRLICISLLYLVNRKMISRDDIELMHTMELLRELNEELEGEVWFEKLLCHK